MRVNIQYEKEIPVISLAGRLDSSGAAAFEAQIAHLNPTGKEGWTLDLSSVDYMSSAGIRSLIIIEKKLRFNGGRLTLCGLTEPVANVLQIAGLDRVFLISREPDFRTSKIAKSNDSTSSPDFKTVYHNLYDIRYYPEHRSTIQIWGYPSAGNGDLDSRQSFKPFSFRNFGIGFGKGGNGESLSAAKRNAGLFISLGDVAGVVPSNDICKPDFFLTRTSGMGQFYALSAVGWKGSPAYSVYACDHGPIAIATVVNEIIKACRPTNTSENFSFVIFADSFEGQMGYMNTPQDFIQNQKILKRFTGGEPMVGVGRIVTNNSESANIKQYISGHAIVLSTLKGIDNFSDPDDIVHQLSFPYDYQNIYTIEPETRISKFRVWIYCSC